ncbi:hypothetical protein B0H12DRAFT_1080853 [Mycena haematopus]|nr:hypothetical protein B0H12DRAFT_1080853 [Mycena haematopus]
MTTRTNILRPTVSRDVVFSPQDHPKFGTLFETVACSVTLEILSTESLPTRHEIAAHIELQAEVTHIVEQLMLQDLIQTLPDHIKWTVPSYHTKHLVSKLGQAAANKNQAISPSTLMASADIFKGQYAVFSHHVPEPYLHHYVLLGGLIATTPQEIDQVTFCVCNDRLDTKFISMWWDNTYRIVSRRFIFDCASKCRRVSEQTYSWGVDVKNDFEIVPTFTICDWSGPMLPKKVDAGEKRKVVPPLFQEQQLPTPASSLRAFQTGLLTPAPSIDPHAPKKRKKVAAH